MTKITFTALMRLLMDFLPEKQIIATQCPGMPHRISLTTPERKLAFLAYDMNDRIAFNPTHDIWKLMWEIKGKSPHH